ncbi:MAG TPA: hypothetical protein VFL34_10550 [Candidatus Sulfotelmatobacter sp.]|nr:hypothetical protein [Candidatus Sulfotelmatobacter sp.]
MKSSHSGTDKKEIEMELKYCEHCGSLWVRRRGGGVYCDKCQRAMEQLPAATKKPSRVMLPVHPPTAIKGHAFGIDAGDRRELEVRGGLL